MSNSWLTRLQEKWELNSITQVIIVLIVFSLTGTTIALTKLFFMSFFGLEDANALAKILIGVLAYQVLILIYGTLLGQFRFFWNKEKKLVLAIGKLFRWIYQLPSKVFRSSPNRANP